MASDSLAKSVICLTVFVVINAVALVVVTVIECKNIRDLESTDTDLELDIDELFSFGDFGSYEDIRNISSAFRRAVEEVAPSHDRSRRSGLEDIFMDMLKTQETVIERHCKDTTKVCKQGDKGDVGPAGDSGPRGSQGAPGTKGFRGYQGPRGVKGPIGLAGAPGARGAVGVTGLPGINGAVGDKGGTGTKGVQGPKGEPEAPGVKGDKGVTGNHGLPGNAGLRGDPGAQGIRGGRGVPGHKGAKGEPGKNGTDADKLGAGCECLKKPTIAGPENEVKKAAYGSRVTLTCNADGIPPPKIIWSTKTLGPIITIPRVTSFDYLTYECTASNVFGTDTKNITLSS